MPYPPVLAIAIAAKERKDDVKLGQALNKLIDEDPSGECLRPVQMAFVKGTETGVACSGVGQPKTVVVAPPASTPGGSQAQSAPPTPTVAAPPNPVPQSQTP